jgi:hypothetical protein
MTTPHTQCTTSTPWLGCLLIVYRSSIYRS